ncbi:DUF4245 domain-containing protein [Kocuria sp. NPDC057446]|uniref:DUF4245 domain-containing protein n=1 Tax=Kocuria sp. NPDC057446 TaxID=3346137 RepID=UPI0036A43383
MSSSTPDRSAEHRPAEPPAGAGTAAGPGVPGPDAPAPDAPGQPLPQLTEKQARRINAPVQGMIISMAVLLLLVLPFVWLQPRPDAQPYRPDVDVAQEAAYVADEAPFTPVVPEPGEGWSANYARWNGGAAEGVPYWEIGWVTPQGSFIGLVQTSLANPTWLAQQTEALPATAEVEAGGVPWNVHVREESRNQDALTVYTGEVNGSTVVLKGDAPGTELDRLATTVAEDLTDAPAPRTTEMP